MPRRGRGLFRFAEARASPRPRYFQICRGPCLGHPRYASDDYPEIYYKVSCSKISQILLTFWFSPCFFFLIAIISTLSPRVCYPSNKPESSLKVKLDNTFLHHRYGTKLTPPPSSRLFTVLHLGISGVSVVRSQKVIR